MSQWRTQPTGKGGAISPTIITYTYKYVTLFLQEIYFSTRRGGGGCFRPVTSPLWIRHWSSQSIRKSIQVISLAASVAGEQHQQPVSIRQRNDVSDGNVLLEHRLIRPRALVRCALVRCLSASYRRASDWCRSLARTAAANPSRSPPLSHQLRRRPTVMETEPSAGDTDSWQRCRRSTRIAQCAIHTRKMLCQYPGYRHSSFGA